MALLGITQFGLLIALLNYGLRFIPSARGALIFATTPHLTMGLAAVLRQERLTPSKGAGVLLTIVGMGLAVGEKALPGGGRATGWTGELAVLASALSAAVCSGARGAPPRRGDHDPVRPRARMRDPRPRPRPRPTPAERPLGTPS